MIQPCASSYIRTRILSLAYQKAKKDENRDYGIIENDSEAAFEVRFEARC